MVNRDLANIMTDDVAGPRDWYLALLPLKLHYDSDWFVILVPGTASGGPPMELGIIERNNPIVPESFRATPQGIYLTFVVDDVDIIFAHAQMLGVPVLEEPNDTFYGQRRMLVEDPNGLLIDVSSPVRA